MKKEKSCICVIAGHIKPNSLQHTCTVSNIKYLSEVSQKIILINSYKNPSINEEIESKYKDLDIEFIDSINYAGLGHAKWSYCIDNHVDQDFYTDILLTNDSFLLVNSIESMRDLHYTEKYDFTGIVSSREGSWHTQDFLRFYKMKNANKLSSWYKEYQAMMSITGIVEDLTIEEFYQNEKKMISAEINSTSIFPTVGCRYILPLTYKKNIHFDDEMLMDYLQNKDYPVVKIKKMNYTYYNDKSMPKDFNHKTYLQINKDLPFTSKEECVQHFKNHGMMEGRFYKHKQKKELPNYLKPFIEKEIGDVCN